MIARVLTALAGLALLAPAAQAQEKQLSAKDVVTPAPGIAYIVYRSRVRTPLVLARTPNAEEMAAWRAERADALEKAQAKYVKDKAKYDREYENYIQFKDLPGPQAYPRPTRPVRPTEENFNYPMYEALNLFKAGSGRSVTKAKDAFTYIVAVKPGTYTVYGYIEAFGSNMTGICMCMGSVSFAAEGGAVTDLGELRFPGIEAFRLKQDVKTFRVEGLVFGEGLTSLAISRATPQMPLPPQLKGIAVKPAEFTAADKLPNFYGVLVDRLTPMPGVLSYRRDTVIDARTGMEVVAVQ